MGESAATWGLALATVAASAVSTAATISNANKQRDQADKLAADQKSAQDQQIADYQQIQDNNTKEQTDAASRQANYETALANKSRQRGYGSGRSSTLLTGPLGVPEDSGAGTGKTLLGT